jgi:dipeptidase D
MLWCTEIPRGSGNLAGIRSALGAVADQLGLTHAQDAAGNVKIVKPATPGYEASATVVIQAHMDMVVISDEAVRPGFAGEKDCVIPYVENGWLRARGTSLGADDGMGIAMCLTILELPAGAAQHPKIECLFTADEETTMVGAEGLTGSFLCPNARHLINVDSEDKNKLCLGCAGGVNAVLSLPVKRDAALAQGAAALSINLAGFSGGHTGVDILKGKANALKVLARLLLHVLAERSAVGISALNLIDFQGGKASNAIPASAMAVVSVRPASAVDSLTAALRRHFEVVVEEFQPIEPASVTLQVTPQAQADLAPLVEADTEKVLHFWCLAPCEPLRMSPTMAGFVETSCAITLSKIRDNVAEFQGLARTSRETQFAAIEHRLAALATLSGASLHLSNRFPGWLPQPSSSLAMAAVAAHQTVAGFPCEVYSVHAGLECGFLLQKYPAMDAVSIGPQIENPHCPDERCEIASGEQTFAWLLEILRLLK